MARDLNLGPTALKQMEKQRLEKKFNIASKTNLLTWPMIICLLFIEVCLWSLTALLYHWTVNIHGLEIADLKLFGGDPRDNDDKLNAVGSINLTIQKHIFVNTFLFILLLPHIAVFGIIRHHYKSNWANYLSLFIEILGAIAFYYGWGDIVQHFIRAEDLSLSRVDLGTHGIFGHLTFVIVLLYTSGIIIRSVAVFGNRILHIKYIGRFLAYQAKEGTTARYIFLLNMSGFVASLTGMVNYLFLFDSIKKRLDLNPDPPTYHEMLVVRFIMMLMVFVYTGIYFSSAVKHYVKSHMNCVSFEELREFKEAERRVDNEACAEQLIPGVTKTKKTF